MRVWQVLSWRRRTQLGDLSALKAVPPPGGYIDGILMLAGSKEGRGQQQHERDLSRVSARYRFPGMRHVP
ncbi:hypothetical protein NBRC3257_1834 [Gluconobacter thailandicus NBRC 3257]|uniref:Uncharacterized protein n=1 Tax=Gluconobacter thailandicus NBRC 3257 TaxID=1381097 RepID=A0ABQ0IXB6_GLUTH|nr:hypothetical protein NBRC3255_2975 [Gluconobacter thailandicus NBRC 3255]GAD26836.1 hypothetical protein NBRC3257_1834 [Gluconobacter thailandicus NBRC 3257]